MLSYVSVIYHTVDMLIDNRFNCLRSISTLALTFNSPLFIINTPEYTMPYSYTYNCSLDYNILLIFCHIALLKKHIIQIYPNMHLYTFRYAINMVLILTFRYAVNMVSILTFRYAVNMVSILTFRYVVNMVSILSLYSGERCLVL